MGATSVGASVLVVITVVGTNTVGVPDNTLVTAVVLLGNIGLCKSVT